MLKVKDEKRLIELLSGLERKTTNSIMYGGKKEDNEKLFNYATYENFEFVVKDYLERIRREVFEEVEEEVE